MGTVEDIAKDMFDNPSVEIVNHKPRPLTLGDSIKLHGPKEPWADRMVRMLRPMSRCCSACSMCELGRKLANDGHQHTKLEFDPHVFSNMNPSRWVVIGQNPGVTECLKGEPFIGKSGEAFDREIEKNNISRSTFYISNAVKCHTENNKKPSVDHMDRCRPFLQMELFLLRPRLVITLGAVAFSALCPDMPYTENLGKIITSKRFGVKIFPIYHPSPLNLSVPERLKKFKKDIEMLCLLIKKIDSQDNKKSSP